MGGRAWAAGLGFIEHDDLVRLLCGHIDLRRVVTDDLTGAPIDLGPIIRHPSAVMRARVQLRDRTCRFPYCTAHAIKPNRKQADLDHVEAHRPDGTGGATADANLAVLCRGHHRIKHHTAWTAELHADGRMTWHNTHLGLALITSPRGDTQPA